MVARLTTQEFSCSGILDLGMLKEVKDHVANSEHSHKLIIKNNQTLKF